MRVMDPFMQQQQSGFTTQPANNLTVSRKSTLPYIGGPIRSTCLFVLIAFWSEMSVAENKNNVKYLLYKSMILISLKVQ